MFPRHGEAYLGVFDLQAPRRQHEGDKRGGKEHLQERNVALAGLEAFGERAGIVDAKASRSPLRAGVSTGSFGG